MSSSKRKPLDISAIGAAAVAQPDPVHAATVELKPEPHAARPAKGRAGGSRTGRVQIQGYFPDDTRRALKMLAAKQDRTVEELLGEAISDLLAKHHAI